MCMSGLILEQNYIFKFKVFLEHDKSTKIVTANGNRVWLTDKFVAQQLNQTFPNNFDKKQ